MEDLRVRRDQSTFRKEFNLIGGRLVQTGKAWFKSQGIILFITMGLCIGGMFFIGNSYYIMAGIEIGILDALPIFGTGTVLIPWAVLELFGFFGFILGPLGLLLVENLVEVWTREPEG